MKMSRVFAFPIVVAITSSALNVSAQDRRTEALARDAMRKAQLDYELHAYDSAIARLDKAIKACTPIRCTPVTRASLVRDRGVMQFRKGDVEGAHDSFAHALTLDRGTEIDPNDVTPDLTAMFQGVKDEASGLPSHAPPPGDFVHTPAAEQAVNTPLPIYVEYTGSTPLTQVVAKYKNASSTEFKKIRLTKHGEGWAGYVPCADVTRGVVRYFVQGFDEAGTPVALSGDAKRTFVVPIRDALRGDAPHIPGSDPPALCSASGECVQGTAGCGEPVAPVETPSELAEPPPSAAPKFRRLWIGASGSLDIMLLPSNTDVCKIGPTGAPANSSNYYCTTPFGADFPSRTISDQNDSLAPGNAGKANGGPAIGDVRVVVSIDYAVSANALLGVRGGLVTNTYQAKAAVNDGRTFGPPLHFEARGTYLFGDEPLAHVGFAPMAFAAFAVARYDASTVVAVTRTGITGVFPTEAWRVTGPWGAVVGGGFRYAFSQRAEFEGAFKVTEAFGGGGSATILAPEVSVHYGF